MQKLITADGRIVLEKTTYMEDVLLSTYKKVGFAAVLLGTLDNVWEELIATQIGYDYHYGSMCAKQILAEVNEGPIYTQLDLLAAADLIKKSQKLSV